MKTLYWLSVFVGSAAFLLFILSIVYGFLAAYSRDLYDRVIHAEYGPAYFFMWRYLFIAVACLIIMETV